MIRRGQCYVLCLEEASKLIRQHILERMGVNCAYLGEKTTASEKARLEEYLVSLMSAKRSFDREHLWFKMP
jgi:hypothetical protein